MSSSKGARGFGVVGPRGESLEKARWLGGGRCVGMQDPDLGTLSKGLGASGSHAPSLQLAGPCVTP